MMVMEYGWRQGKKEEGEQRGKGRSGSAALKVPWHKL